MILRTPYWAEAVRWALGDQTWPATRLDSVRDSWYEVWCNFCDWETTGYESVVEDAMREHLYNEHPSKWVPVAKGYYIPSGPWWAK